MSEFKVVLFILAGLCWPMASFCQIDTLAIARELDHLDDIESHRAFWKQIRDRDQEFRGHQTVEAIDELNLVAASMYYNRFGIPKKSDLGSYASTISMVWIHNRSTVVDAMTFPLVLGRFLAHDLDEKTMREYHLRVKYQRQFEDKGYLSKPLPEIFKALDLNVSPHIDIAGLLTELATYRTFNAQPKTILGTWKSPDIDKTYSLNDAPYQVTYKGGVVEIYRLDSGQYYYNVLYEDNSFDPAELIPLDTLGYTFKFKDKVSDKFLDCSNSEELILTDPAGAVHRRYAAIQSMPRE
jgi:hypothetical protein